MTMLPSSVDFEIEQQHFNKVGPKTCHCELERKLHPQYSSINHWGGGTVKIAETHLPLSKAYLVRLAPCALGRQLPK